MARIATTAPSSSMTKKAKILKTFLFFSMFDFYFNYNFVSVLVLYVLGFLGGPKQELCRDSLTPCKRFPLKPSKTLVI